MWAEGYDADLRIEGNFEPPARGVDAVCSIDGEPEFACKGSSLYAHTLPAVRAAVQPNAPVTMSHVVAEAGSGAPLGNPTCELNVNGVLTALESCA
jgi:hypothetical protein